MENTCSYSDNWQPYIGDYDKFEYDIKLNNGTIVENCYPNGGKFNSISDEHDGLDFDESLVSEIRFSQRPRFMINDDVSSAEPDIEYLKRMDEKKNSLKEDNYISNTIQNFRNELFTRNNIEPRKVDTKPGRNEKCTCGSNKKFKKCCI